MKTGLDIVALALKIEANKELKHDVIADTRAIEMQVDTDGVTKLNVATQSTSGFPTTGYPILPLAHDHIGTRLAIPAKYYDRMNAEQPDLLATNVNTWLRTQKPERRMLRTLGGDLRAFLSNRYQRIENEEIAEIALPILARIPDVQIVSAEITERRMYIQAVCPRIQGEVRKGDVIQAGVVISNSEVGCGAVSIAALDYRLICLNGMISAEKFRAYHVGRQIEDNADLWRDDTRQADDRAVLLKVRDMVTSAVDASRFELRLERMRELTELEVKGDPAKAVEVLARKVGATEAERGGILGSLIKGGTLSAWGMLNAVTAQAHTASSYDRGVEFEAAGGLLLSLNRKEWREVLEAV